MPQPSAKRHPRFAAAYSAMPENMKQKREPLPVFAGQAVGEADEEKPLSPAELARLERELFNGTQGVG